MLSDRDKVDNNLINFKILISSILNDKFHQTLPNPFKPVIDIDKHKQLGLQSTKRSKDEKNQQESRLENNLSPIPEWIVEDKETY